MGSPRCEFGRGLYTEEEVAVTLTHDFEIQDTEVTQAQWTSLGIASPSRTDLAEYADCASPDCPVGHVTWHSALAFANRLSEAHAPPLARCYDLIGCEGQLGAGLSCSGAKQLFGSIYDCPGYRLPTDAEWEYAARAGTRTSFYLGQNRPRQQLVECVDEPALAPAAWYCFNAGKKTHPVKQLVPNAWGLYDVLGNVGEWTSDPYRARAESVAKHVVDPGRSIAVGGEVAMRGGNVVGWSDIARASNRLDQAISSVGGLAFGMRLVRTLPAKDAGGK